MVEYVLVRIADATWELPGLPPGVYPVKPLKAGWRLDKGRKRSSQVTRCQLPLLPAYACTANAAQGGNWSKAITDINVSGNMSKQGAYVSLSRVRRSQDVWIFRKFPRHVFCGGGQVGPELLLKRLRGEAIAWEQVAEKLRGRPQRCEKNSPQVACATCPATEFTIRELLKGPQRQCTACSNCRRCPTCTVAIPPGTSRCLWCAGYSICRSCGQEFLPPGNSQHAWCAACQKKHGTLWVCGRCTLAKPLRHFSHQRDGMLPRPCK